MKKLLCLALLLAVFGCEGCAKTIHIIHDRNNPDDSMGIVVVPLPMPDLPMPVPSWPPPEPLEEDGDPWCMNMLPGIYRS